ncbi:SsgA family sporulation/cell division regulator [Streptomyces sp. NRRL F-5727]|uniref:SsgA family sporulation/cell division regulator n=1 Tax=Streptomyces sp. NRRL F-5727 TaxID=1463871 RepID=UPI0004C49CE6|nr:SsgA family sporulation/cell division regulator [Streptomyces sp. NRRL F-5727]
MNRNHSDVQRRTAQDGGLVLTLGIERVLGLSARQAVEAEFLFSPEAPWIVSVELLVEGGPRARWRIGRELLQQGLHSMSGLGDIQMWPSNLEERATSWLQLCSGDMAALFELPAPPLADWLERTYELVPAGRELTGVEWGVAADLPPARRRA